LIEQDLDEAIKLAGFSKTSIVGEMHAFRANDPRENDIAEGHNPIQVCYILPMLQFDSLFKYVVVIHSLLRILQIILDQAAHLMDAVALGTEC